MADLTKFKPDGVTQMRVTRLTGWFVSLGGAGTITQQAGTSSAFSGGQQCGVGPVSRTGAGNFLLPLHRGYKRLIRGDVTLSSVGAGTAPGGANLGTVAVVSAGNFTGATPVAAATGVSITTVLSSAAATPADPAAGVIVTYDLEFADI